MPRLVYLQVEGYRDLAGRFAKATAELKRAQREELRELGRELVDVLQAEAPKRTGKLAQGIRYNTREGRNGSSLSVTSQAPYTGLVVGGRGPVEAKQARALRFEPGRPGSGFIFRKRVGPAKPNPFPERALAKLGQEPEATARRIATRVVKAYGVPSGKAE